MSPIGHAISMGGLIVGVGAGIGFTLAIIKFGISYLQVKLGKGTETSNWRKDGLMFAWIGGAIALFGFIYDIAYKF
tara:strand:+ start:1687 stop:1914 length:228 start_codon:yes stop_codon:yes gene_type:complete